MDNNNKVNDVLGCTVPLECHPLRLMDGHLTILDHKGNWLKSYIG